MLPATYTRDIFAAMGCAAALALANIALALEASPPWHRGRAIRGAMATVCLILLVTGALLLAEDPSSATWYKFCRATITSCFAIPQVFPQRPQTLRRIVADKKQIRATYVLATSYRTLMTIVVGLLLLLWVAAGTVLWQSQSLSLLLGLAHLELGLLMADNCLQKWRGPNKTKNSRTAFIWLFIFPAAAATISFVLGVLARFNKPVDHQFAILHVLTVFILVPAMIHEHTTGPSRVLDLRFAVASQSPLDLKCQCFGQEDPEKKSD